MSTTDSLEKLPDIGPEKAASLRNNGYTSFEDIVKSSPGTLRTVEGITLSTATRIITASVEKLRVCCPECTGDVSAAFQARDVDVPSDSEIICPSCHWGGQISDGMESSPADRVTFNSKRLAGD